MADRRGWSEPARFEPAISGSAAAAVGRRHLELAMSEDDLKAQVLDLAATYGWLSFHPRPARTQHGWTTAVEGDGAGFPDLVLVHRHHGVVFAELKNEAGEVSADQQVWLERLTEAGAEVYVWRPRHFEHIHDVLAGGRTTRRG